MKKTQTLLLIATPLLGTGCLPKASAGVYLTSFELSGDVAAVADSGSISASDEASLSDLGLGDTETGVGARADFDWLGFHLSASSLDASFSGDGEAETDITFDDESITAGTDVDSSLDVTAFTGAVTYGIPLPIVDFGIGIGVIQLDLDMDLDPESGSSIGTEISELIPVAVGRLGFGLGPFDVGATVGFLSVDVGDLDGTVMDLDLAASYGLIGGDDHLKGAITLGYRSLSIESEYDDGDSEVEVDFEVGGPYLGITVTF